MLTSLQHLAFDGPPFEPLEVPSSSQCLRLSAVMIAQTSSASAGRKGPLPWRSGCQQHSLNLRASRPDRTAGAAVCQSHWSSFRGGWGSAICGQSATDIASPPESDGTF